MVTRTDAHRPSAINPDDYSYVASDYYGPSWGGPDVWLLAERKVYRAHMERTGGKSAHSYSGGTCHICGAAALTVARYHHAKTNTYIVTGMDCAAKMEMGGVDAFKAIRKAIINGRKVGKAKVAAHAELTRLGLTAAWELSQTVQGERTGWKQQEQIVDSIVAKLIRYGNISEKQVELVNKLLIDIAERPRIEAERAAKKAEIAAASNWVGTVGQRLDFALTVNFRTSFETDYGVMHIHVMTDDNGNVVVYKGNKLAEKGETIKIKATVKTHGEREGVKQTIVSRPKVLETTTAQG